MGIRDFVQRRMSAISRQTPDDYGSPWSACAGIGIVAPTHDYPLWCAAIVVAPYSHDRPTLIYTRGGIQSWTSHSSAPATMAAMVARQTIRNSHTDTVIASSPDWESERGLIRRSWPRLDTWHAPRIEWKTLHDYKNSSDRAYTALATGALAWHAPRLDLSPRLWGGSAKSPREPATVAALAAVDMAHTAARRRCRTSSLVRYANRVDIANLISYQASDICTWCSATIDACIEDRYMTARALAGHYGHDVYRSSTAGPALTPIIEPGSASRSS